MINDKRKKFCHEYVKDLNGSEAAIRAGYSVKTAKQEAYKLLNDPGVQKYLEGIQNKIAKRNEVSIDKIIQDLIEINNINMADLYDKDGQLKNLADLPKEFTRCIQEVQLTRAGTKYKFYSRTDAIDKLARHLGFYERDNTQSKPDVNFIMHVPDQETADEIKKLNEPDESI